MKEGYKNTFLILTKLLQDAFAGCTVLTIAHRFLTAAPFIIMTTAYLSPSFFTFLPKSRLDTVMGYDLVLVLDQGRLVEKGWP